MFRAKLSVLATELAADANCIAYPSECGAVNKDVWVADRHGRITLRSAETGCIRSVISQGGRRVLVCALCCTKRRVWCARSDGVVDVYAVDGADLVCSLPPPSSINYTSGALHLASAHNCMFVGYGSSAVLRYHAATAELQHSYRGLTSPIRCLAVHGCRLYAGTVNSRVAVWDVFACALLRTIKVGELAVQCVAISPSGSELWTATADGTLKVFDEGVGTLLFRADTSGAPPEVTNQYNDCDFINTTCQLARLGDAMCVVSWDGTVVVRRTEAPYDVLFTHNISSEGEAVAASRARGVQASPQRRARLQSIVACAPVRYRVSTSLWIATSSQQLQQLELDVETAPPAVRTNPRTPSAMPSKKASAAVSGGAAVKTPVPDAVPPEDNYSEMVESFLKTSAVQGKQVATLEEQVGELAKEVSALRRHLHQSQAECEAFKNAANEAYILMGGQTALTFKNAVEAISEKGQELTEYVTALTAERNAAEVNLRSTRALLASAEEEVESGRAATQHWRESALQTRGELDKLRITLHENVAARKERERRAVVLLQTFTTRLRKQYYTALKQHANEQASAARQKKAYALLCSQLVSSSSSLSTKENARSVLTASDPIIKSRVAGTTRVTSSGPPTESRANSHSLVRREPSAAQKPAVHFALQPSVVPTCPRSASSERDDVVLRRLAITVMGGLREMVIASAFTKLQGYALHRKATQMIRSKACRLSTASAKVTLAYYLSKLAELPRKRKRHRSQRANEWKLAHFAEETQRRLVFGWWLRWAAGRALAVASSARLLRRRAVMAAVLCRTRHLQHLQRRFETWTRFSLLRSQCNTLSSLQDDLVRIQRQCYDDGLDHTGHVRGFVIATREQLLLKLFEQYETLEAVTTEKGKRACLHLSSVCAVACSHVFLVPPSLMHPGSCSESSGRICAQVTRHPPFHHAAPCDTHREA